MDASEWNKLSDFEINTSVALALGGEVCSWPNPPRLGVTFDGAYAVDFDYCNNPSDAWPIIVENKISNGPYAIRISRNDYVDGWFAVADDECLTYVTDINPLRAAMICFLMLKESTHGE